ncbi:glutamate--tRNA ligase [Pseudomonadota bacterium]
MKVVTRFAPSPTGMIHIGSARTALFNYLFAKRHGGEYKLRIEDTDTKRNVEGGVDAIINGFDWLGIHHDGKIVFQSKNIKRHKEVASELLKSGKAYYCYTSQEELASLREEAKKRGKVFKFKSPWREKKPSDTPKGISPVIRIKAPLKGEIKIDDAVLGAVTVPADALDDFIILRSDGTPTYMFAVVVDDHDMDITHIIRGNEHFNNAFRQKIIFDTMAWKTPKFCHIPLIHGPDGKKLSKRHGASSIMEYKEMGYLPETLNNYLLRLGWSHGNDEIITMEQAVKWFNLESLQKSPARFDFDKLNNINKHYIKLKDNTELLQLAFASGLTQFSAEEKHKMLRAMNMIKDRAVRITDIKDASTTYISGCKQKLDEKSQKIIDSGGKEMLSEIYKSVLQYFNSTSWNAEELKVRIKNFGDKKDWKMRDYTQAMRVAITFASVSPGGIFEIMEILGKDESLKRIENIL